MNARSMILAAASIFATCLCGQHVACADEKSESSVVIDFESAEIGTHVESWKEKDVVFSLAHEPKKSKAKGRVMFFPHIASQHKGILNAMADESIPLKVEFPSLVRMVELKLWGSTTSAAVVEAFDSEGKLIDRASLDQVPVRKRPQDPVPLFELSVSGSEIASIQISGSQPGGFIAVDELRFYPMEFEKNASLTDVASPDA